MHTLVYIQEKAANLKHVFSLVKDMLAECELQFNQDGLFICGCDPDKTSVLDIRLLSLGQYSCSKDIRFGVFTSALYKCLRLTDPEDDVVFKIMGDDESNLNIDIIKKSFTVSTILPAIESNQNDVFIKDTTYSYEVEVNTKTLSKIIKEVSQFCSTFRLQTTSSGLPLIVKSVDYVGSVVLSLVGSQWIYHKDEPFEQEYMVKYIDKFCKSMINKTTTLRFDTNKQLVLSKSIPWVGSVSLHVAPMIN